MEDKRIKDIERRLLILESMISDIYDETVSSKKVCPICGSQIRLYVPFGVVNLRRNACCPVCRALERHRALWLYIQNKTEIFSSDEKLKVLHFAPEKAFLYKFSNAGHIDYYPVDINPEKQGIRDVADIQKMKYDDTMFDVIICNHVLEHIPDERAALIELHRVLKPSGFMLLMVPINRNCDTTYENPDHNTPELRLEYYGQEDHVRMYGNDFNEVLERADFTVEVIEPWQYLSHNEISYYSLIRDEKIFKCTV